MLETFRYYNSQTVILGTALLGMVCGILGTFLLLRKRSLVGDAISHASLPGIAVAYLLARLLLRADRSFTILLIGAIGSASVAMLLLICIRAAKRTKEDSVIAILLSSFFGAGVALLGIIQKLPTGHAAGLHTFIYGDSAALLRSDLWLIVGVTAVVLLCVIALFKEFNMLCFDTQFAIANGFRATLLDGILIGLTVITVIISLQAVGLLLAIALLILPALSGRFWSDSALWHAVISAAIGAISATCGAFISAGVDFLPTGAAIVLTAGIIFTGSILGGRRHGVITNMIARRLYLREHQVRQLLLALRRILDIGELIPHIDELEYLEVHATCTLHALDDHLLLPTHRIWFALRIAERRQYIERGGNNTFHLTPHGMRAMLMVIKKHEYYHAFINLFPQLISHIEHESNFHFDEWLNTEQQKILEEHILADNPFFRIIPQGALAVDTTERKNTDGDHFFGLSRKVLAE